MNAWQRFARQRLARSRWNSDPTALEPADTQAFEQAWQRQCRMEQAIVARVPESDIPAALLENITASLAVWLDEGEFTPPERAAIVLHHARLEVGFTDIARQAPQPDLSTVQAWYLRHQTQFMRPEQRLSRGLLYPQLETALFSLAENALSLPVASELGWHLLWCEAIRPAAPMEPQQALESARDYLWQQSQQRHQRQWLEQTISRQPGLCG